MSRISIGQPPPRHCTRKEMLRRCKNNEEADDVILIDVDSESSDNVIFVDIPESLPKKRQGSSRLGKDNWLFGNVINIDDDDTPDSSPFIGVNSVLFSAGTSSNIKSSGVSPNFGDSATPVRLSKCKRTYSGKTFRRNRYGLDTDSECDSSDNDYLDCELVEDSSGRVQEQWEKAFSRRRKGAHKGNSGIRDHDGTSCFANKDNHQNAESEDETRQSKEASFCFTSGKSNNTNDASSHSKAKNDTDFGCTHLSDDDAIDDMQNKKFDAHGKSNSCEPGCSNTHIEERKKNPASSSFASHEVPSWKFNHAIPIVEDEETSEVALCPPESDLYVDEDSFNGKSRKGEATACKGKSSFECEINRARSFPENKHRNIHKTATRRVKERDHLRNKQSHTTERYKEMKNLIPERCSFERSALDDEQNESLFSRSVLCSVEGENGNHKNTRPLVPDIPLFESIHINEYIQEDNSMSNIQQQENKDGQQHSQNGETCFPEETCLISEREKLKETDEYKRAIEEEWASRQQALLIQAEEARRLRQLQKRRKAESMRILDMERRQKERLEEMRDIQKKDEENMNMKETIRYEVRNELKKLETECKNMASLLHLLGIQVANWPNSSRQEVQTAYKRALLTFHPDRASQSDIRQQVEAEEKFKLINLLREKLPPS